LAHGMLINPLLNILRPRDLTEALLASMSLELLFLGVFGTDLSLQVVLEIPCFPDVFHLFTFVVVIETSYIFLNDVAPKFIVLCLHARKLFIKRVALNLLQAFDPFWCNRGHFWVFPSSSQLPIHLRPRVTSVSADAVRNFVSCRISKLALKICFLQAWSRECGGSTFARAREGCQSSATSSGCGSFDDLC